MLARIYGVCALKCSGCGGRVRLIGFITEPATVRQILAYVGEPTTAPAIAPARSPPVEANAQQLIAPSFYSACGLELPIRFACAEKDFAFIARMV